MRVILAGATGVIGRPLTTALLEAGHQVIGITRSAAAAEQNDRWIDAVVADVGDLDALLAAAAHIRADAVVNQVTALTRPPTRYRDLQPTDRIRVLGTRHLLALARQTGASRLLTQSFLGGYGFRDHRPVLRQRGSDRIDEHYPFDGPAGSPKLEATVGAIREAERLTTSATDIDGIALRYGIFYGAGGPLESTLARLRKRQLPLPTNGGGIHSYIWLPDAASATVAALEHGIAGQAYNICDDQPVPWNTFVETTAATFDAPRPLHIPGRIFRAAPYLYDFMTSVIPMSNQKARRELDWRPTAPTVVDGLTFDRAGQGVTVVDGTQVSNAGDHHEPAA